MRGSYSKFSALFAPCLPASLYNPQHAEICFPDLLVDIIQLTLVSCNSSALACCLLIGNGSTLRPNSVGFVAFQLARIETSTTDLFFYMYSAFISLAVLLVLAMVSAMFWACSTSPETMSFAAHHCSYYFRVPSGPFRLSFPVLSTMSLFRHAALHHCNLLGSRHDCFLEPDPGFNSLDCIWLEAVSCPAFTQGDLFLQQTLR